MTLRRLTEKQSVMHPDSGITRNEPSSHENMWRKLRSALLYEKSQSEKAVYDSHYRALWKRQHHGTSKMIVSFQSLEEGSGE